ncbi:SWI/SNF-related matrix-associated actin-dependent regulator of chromatin subfamily A-like protein 1 [Lolium rigidum]|uniref:SWI/SNF-related matrix-associated actin-dependent regulator of chromatin subfamily A-like protein 1 n=1 Tax=Lolium rigidum TaxID=89674 RepID=UPI001F5CD2B4|nr:SWI/SNF-related matrix-associated actin-dependent regulator of chromatin subfamily A-like protein 1 [Lolium rigidum]
MASRGGAGACAGGWDSLDDDDWGLTEEQFDKLEQDAYRVLAERKASSSAASTAPIASPLPHRAPVSPAATASSPVRNDHPASRISLESRFGKVEPLSPSRLSQSTAVNNSQGSSSKISVHLFLHSSGMIAAKFPYNQKLVDAFRKIPRASWSGKERVWMFPPTSLSTAEEVLREVPGLAVEVQRLDPLVQRAFAAALAAKDLRGLYDRIPTDVESKLMPFQREGVRFALQHGGRVLIADEMGLGKTLQAIAVASCLHEAGPVLVISPSSLRLHWATMIQHWLNIPTEDILVVLPQTGGSNKAGFRLVYSNTKGDFCLDGAFNVISYDVVPKIQSTLLDLDFKIVIADESHFMKNSQAKRTIASLPVLQKAEYVILLSGTPALSRPIELYTQLQALYPNVYKNVNEYGSRYCQGGFFGVYQGASNHEELHNLMKATVMIRRLKKDVLSELPVKRRQQVFMDLSEKEIKPIRALFRELETVKINMKSCDSQETMESLKFSQKNIINKIYNDSAAAKIPAVLDYLGTIIEADCKFLIFAHHQPMIDAIHQHLLKKKVNCIRIDGQTPVAARQTLVTDFQNKDDIKAAVLSIKAGGVGLTLTAASTVIFAELSWTPGDIIQAEDRAHRIGQVSSVNIYYLLANETVDDIIWDVVQGKLENLGQMLDGEEKTLAVSQSETRPSPSKQKTLDSYLKRCSTSIETQPSPKSRRF